MRTALHSILVFLSFTLAAASAGLADEPAPPEPAPPPAPAPAAAPTPSPWQFEWGGYVHMAYRFIQQPANYDIAGRNNGFQLEQARIGIRVQYKDVVAARVSVEGASEDRVSQSFPGGQITARLRDAYLTWAPHVAFRVSVGQMVTPWDLDSMRSDAELPFVSRAVPVEGVQPTEGFTTRGLGADRSLGIALHSGFIGFGPSKMASLRYQLLVGNGNGQNQLFNDNNLPAVFGRVEAAFWGKQGVPADRVAPMYAFTDEPRLPIVSLGFAAQWNPRTAGNLPDLVRETDTGFTGDIAAALFGAEIQGGIIYMRTTFDTLSSTPDQERFGWWAHARYTIPKLPFAVTPGYRIASYAPRAHLSTQVSPSETARDDALSLLYHTFGITARPTLKLPIHIGLNYTITVERGVNVLNNDRVEADAVVVF